MRKSERIALLAPLAVITLIICAARGGQTASSPSSQFDIDSVAADTIIDDESQQYDEPYMPWGEPRTDTDSAACWQAADSIINLSDAASRYTSISDADFQKVAQELGVEVAAIKAVVRIEAGHNMEGFWAPGVPVINFDRSMYNKARPTRTVKAPASEKVPSGIKSAYGRKEWSQLVAARKVNLDKANMGTFWGMFQIGGFNYKICGCSSVQEFVDRMSYSEYEQLELFAQFVKNSGMIDALRAKNWTQFARKYNGASYARRGYHTRMAAEYAKFKAQER